MNNEKVKVVLPTVEDIDFIYGKRDVVNKPEHYHSNGIDVIGFSELQFTKEELRGFYRINVLKYVTRYQKKNGVEDLEKAEFYLKKLKELEKGVTVK